MSTIDEKYKTTTQLLARARGDRDPVSCFANGTGWNDAQEAIFVAKGKRNVGRAFAALMAAGLLSSKPVISTEEPDGYWFSWIPVSEKLPKVGSWVIGWDASKKTVLRVCHFAVNDFRVNSAAHSGGWIGIFVTHWMPMPEMLRS